MSETKKAKDKEEPPQCQNAELARQSENGDGQVMWSLTTDFTLETVLEPGFFSRTTKHGLRRHDLINAVCEANTTTATYATLAVTVLS